MWLDPNVIVWDPELNTSEPKSGGEGVVDVFQHSDGVYEGAFNKKMCNEGISLGRPVVQCRVRRGEHRDVERAIMDNSFNQSRLDPASEVEQVAYAHRKGFTILEIATDSGRSQKWVKERLLISQADPIVQQSLDEGLIAIGHATLLARVQDPSLQKKGLNLLLMKRLTVRELKDYLREQGIERP